jgi:1-acyl-sn-glycerol-3-phosphate acyltransferase
MSAEPLAPTVPEGIELLLHSHFGGGVEGPEQLILVRALRLSGADSDPIAVYPAVAARLGVVLYTVAHTVIPPALKVIWRPTVRGLEHVPRTGGVILASNHLSFVDSVVIPSVVPRKVVFLAKSDYFTGTGLKGLASRVWFEGLGMLPVDRDDTRAAIASLDIALDVLGRGEAFGIYPEGTRSRDGRLYRGRTGVAHLALTAGVPVVPVGLTGTQGVQPVGSRRPRVVPITVEFGEPLDFTGRFEGVPAGKARRDVTDEVMAAIQKVTGQVEAGIYNERPVE